MSEGAPLRDPLPGWLTLAGLAALAAWVCVQRFQFLTGSPYPMGVDGYWYAVQLRSLLDGGHLYYSSPPLALWLMAPLAAATDPIVGTKLGAALGAAALPLAVHALARRIGGERAIGLLAAAVVATSAGSFYSPAEFVKSAIGLPFAVAALAALGWVLDRPSWRRAALPAALAILAALCHPLALAFALAGAIAPLALAAWESSERLWLTAALASALASALAGLALSRSALFTGLFTATADWSIPALAIDERALHFRGEPAVAGIVGLAALILAALMLLARGRARLRPAVPARDRAFAIGPALWAVATALPWLAAGDPQGLTFRLRAIAFVPLALAGAAVIAALLARLSPARRMTAVMFAAGLVLVRPARYDAPVVQVDPDLAAAVAAIPALPAGAVVVAPERHLVFMTTWYTRAPARLRPGAIPRERRLRLIPMSSMSAGLADALEQARTAAPISPPIAPPIAPIDLHRGDRNGLVLVAEPTWEWVLARLPPAEREHYRAWPVH